jgi:hypothetical protein
MGVSRKQALGRHRHRRRPGRRGPLGLTAPRALRPTALRATSPSKRVPRPSWKLLGLAGIAGVAATGVVVARKRRAHVDLEPDELRQRLRERLDQAAAVSPPQPPDPTNPTNPST